MRHCQRVVHKQQQNDAIFAFTSHVHTVVFIRASEALFDEWSDELEQYKSASLKRESSKKLNATKRQFDQLLRSMRSAESKMEPVLSSLKDNVLYLKHNLNAQAVAAIKGEFTNLKRDIQILMNDMNKSIADSNKFIEQMNKA